MTKDEEKMLDECLGDDNDRLTTWEIEFLESLNRQRTRNLSPKQLEILERINTKVLK